MNKRVVDVPITGGLNTKMSRKNVTPPDFIELRNVRWREEGKITKRYGYSNLGQAVNTGTLNTPVALGAIKDELLMLSTDRLYSYSSADSKWYDKGAVTATSTKLTKVTASPLNSSAVDVIVQDGLRVATWLEGTTIYYSIVDVGTGNAIVDKTQLVASAGSIYPRLASLAGNIYIFYNSSSNLVYLRIPTTAPSSTSTGNLYTDLDSGGMFDVDTVGDHLYVFYKLTGVSTVRIAKVDKNLNVIANNTISSEDPQSYATTVVQAFDSTSAGEKVIFLGWVDSSDNIRTVAYDVSLVQLFAPDTVETLANVDKLVISIDDSTQSQVKYLYSVTAASTQNYYLKGNTVTNAGTIGTAAVVMRSVGLASRPAYHNDVSYVNVLHDSTLQATYFTITNDGRVVAKFAAGEGGTHATTKRPSNFCALTSTSYTFGLLKKGRVQSENATLFADRSPHFADLVLDPAKAFIHTVMHDDFVMAGGVVLSYDGQSTTEYGFHLAPEGVSSADATSGGSMADGTYLVYAVYEWTDKRGVRFQSAPSVAVTDVISGGSGNGKLTVTVPALRITDKSSDVPFSSREDVIVRVFVTEAGGTVPYSAGTATNPNVLSSDTVDIEITSVSLSNEILYTSGGTLDNVAPASCAYLFTHDNRPVQLGVENPHQVRLGKEIKPGQGVGFNEDLVINLDPQGGDTVAGASMDDYMVIFKETAIYAISGSGPNDLGENSTYSAPQLISSDVGCKDVKSVRQMPDGILFKSEKGIYLLSRSLDLTYIGDRVEEYNSTTVLSTDILKTTNEIRFVTDASVTLVYNYYFKRWVVHDTPGALDATTWKDSEYVYLTSSKVLQESSSTWLDDGSYVQSKVRTGWIHLAGMQGFQRIYKMAMLGTYHANHVFAIRHYYDYSEIVLDENRITASTLINTATYGSSDTYGSDDYYGGSQNDEVYQLREDTPRQKCQAISFEFVDSLVDANTGQGFSIEGISLLVGIKSGLNRTSSGRSV